MSRKTKIGLGVLVGLLIISGIIAYFVSVNIPVLEPAGPIGQKEKRLMIEAFLLCMIVVIPVYIMLIGFAWKYRESNKKAKYSPNLNGNRALETIWWGVPIVIISILGVMAFKSSHDLDPFKSLSSSKPSITIQVVALQWRWLFIYPRQDVASINYLKIPVNTPIDFQITSDAPMNSFWIPQLGGQIYAMSGMATQLHLQADKPGNYHGVSANISGDGFADMHFIAAATSADNFNSWINSLHKMSNSLSLANYDQLIKPSTSAAIKYYSTTAPGLFNHIVSKYESPIFLAPGEKPL